MWIHGLSRGLRAGTLALAGRVAAHPGYELLTSLTFDQIIGAETGMAFGPFTAVSTLFEPYVAYNPTTRKFLNHYGGGTYDNVGGLVFTLADGYMLAYYDGFGELGDRLFGDIDLRSTGVRVDRLSGNLTSITSAVTAVPEPASLVLLGTGLLGAVASRRRRAR